ncbi:anthranilate synthase component I [Natronorubrum bangense]|uniref:Anthranilate synthase component 1 n=2 Tax=Natronorubrum bangense TaxID=61858 RepID=A0A4D6HHI1_9EURY|nr:anthranilate synthase component I [Natronorubrum bangense]ELY43979.1 anthranilate synthase component I [Natronorubrum bangense JCM 10635]QCC53015.1 anthranilate synthase component I [Natronorubrum bangense]QCC56292.1 anthranilate synthase component I [Natronorubrum bangense]
MTDSAPSSNPTPTLDIDRETFCEYAGDREDRPAVVRTVATLDVETTPLAAYAALTGRSPSSDRERSSYAFLLESAEKTASSDPDGAFRPSSTRADRHARYSYVGYDPDAVVTVEPEGTTVEALTDDAPLDLLETDVDGDTVDALRAAMPDVDFPNAPDHDRQHLTGGLVGFLAYDAVYDLWLEEVGLERPDSRFPDAQFVLTTKTLAFDEHEGTVSLVCTPILEADADPDAVYDEIRAEARAVAETLQTAEPPETGGFVRDEEIAGPKAEYEESVRRAKEHVLDGDIYQGVISRTRELYGDVDPLGFYEAMRDVNPSPYMYLLDHGDLTVVGASPETLVSVRGREVMSNPIAGTCDRGSSPVEDRRLAGEMLADEKERAEHTMLVDLARNDVRRVSEAGSVRVDEFMNVLKYSHVQHIESTVTGALAADADAFDATRASFPAGTLSGAPKIRAMEIIDDLEAEPRGLYGGGVGYYSWTGDADFAIVIRTATVEHEADRDRITVQAGAGLVADSDPEAEYEETEKKMGGVLAALEAIEISADGSDDDSSGAVETTPEVSR